MLVPYIARRSVVRSFYRSFSSQIVHPSFSSKDSELISDLQAIENRSPKLVKSSTYPAPAEPNISIRSWKMNEFKYYDIPSPFPTLARGVFTMDVSEREDGVKHRIVARGYDKFFNIGEVPWTTWEAIEKHTAAPYTLSLKSNGCVIFIAALTPKKLLITSKHSLGPIDNAEKSHAQAGEQWLRRYLEEKGRTEEEFAARLWENNWTAVAELCDDSFEEHVLGYPPERTGLHLHGINVTTKAFKTMPQDVVDAFAEEWGFIKTRSHVVNSVQEVHDFTSHIGKVGEWEGEAVEGFVVRTHVTEPSYESWHRINNDAKGKPPYTPGSSFFFKIKFDEPYMMYRDWRELTKKLLSTKGPLKVSGLPKSKMRRKETKAYVNWIIGEIQRDRAQFDGYTKGHGIIATRERFLRWYQEQQANGTLEEDDAVVGSSYGKVIIVPVAVPGCGKTSVAVALAHLFKFGHTQSDDIKSKNAAAAFQKSVKDLLKKRNVVIADKNNHLRQHRHQLHQVAIRSKPPAKLIALNWSVVDKSPEIAHQICADRIVNRGLNHQTLVAEGSKHENVIWKFLENGQALIEHEVDECIEMNIEDDLETMVKCAVDGLWGLIGGEGGLMGKEKPSEERIKEALEHVKQYRVKDNSNGKAISPGKQEKQEKQKKQEKPPRYYGLLPAIELEETVNGVFAKRNRDSGVQFWENLKKAGRVTWAPHVTIVHHRALPQEQGVWNLSRLVVASTSPPVFNITFGKLLWNNRVMVLTVDRIEQISGSDTLEGRNFLDGIPDATKNRLHLTVGTAESNIPAVEGKNLVQKWKSEGKKANEIFEADIDNGLVVTGQLKGLFS
ncbi:hypothetical protein Agabi119p4_9342 [Agaricus bisporus var. burnettii]|uniref:tRNA ligase n=1 Tax=Agaricus bisporus var. burnettii TaxID=192524 RepID=A0A8H7EX91_AGABI|nr:hypothetical protein Agabi119p4_9342 [Agaricus bisporus var. burnettii]